MTNGKLLQYLPFSEKELAMLFGYVMDYGRDIFVITGADNETIRYANPALHEALGYKNGELVGKPVSGIFKDQAERKTSILPEVMEKGYVKDRVIILSKNDGDDLYTRASIIRIPDALLAGGGTLGLAKDITNEVHEEMGKLALLYERLEVKNPYLKGHSRRVCDYSFLIADAMSISYANKKVIERGAPLHDIGKLSFADELLSSKEQFEASQNPAIRRHPTEGELLLKNYHFYTPEIGAIVRWHHERPDGKGYPDGLTEDKIPQVAQIVGAADALDAMTSDRPYKKGKKATSCLEARKRIAAGIGKQFPERIVKAFAVIPLEKLEEISQRYRA